MVSHALMLAIPLAIFVLPAILQKLDFTLGPKEVLEGKPADASGGRNFQSEQRSARDQDPKESEEFESESSKASLDGCAEPVDTGQDQEMNEGTELHVDAVRPVAGPNTNRSDLNVNGEIAEIEDSLRSEAVQQIGIDCERASQVPNPRRACPKIASLRAAFEKPEEVPDTASIRSSSSGRANLHCGKDGMELEAEVIRLREDLHRERDMRIAYEEKVTTLEAEIEELNRQRKERDHAWCEEREQKVHAEPRILEERMQSLTEELKSRTLEVDTLHKQPAKMKLSILPTEVSDTYLQEQLGVLHYELQNLVVTNFRRVRMDVTPDTLRERWRKVSRSERPEELQRIFEVFDPGMKLVVLQAIVAHYLTTVLNDSYLFGLPKDLGWAKSALEATDALSTVLPNVSYSNWRSLTFDALRQSEQVKPILVKSMNDFVEEISSRLEAITELESVNIRSSALKTLIERALDLAHSIQVQRARYKFILPATGEHFDASMMEDITACSDAQNARTVKCATFPVVFKSTDASGETLQSRPVLIKAKVLCNG